MGINLKNYILDVDLLTKISALTRGQRQAAMKALGELEWERCSKDILYWIDKTRHPAVAYVYTHDPKPLYTCLQCNTTTPYKFNQRKIHLAVSHNINTKNAVEIASLFVELPTIREFTVKPYIPPIIEAWQNEQFFFVEKSRDMIATWTIITCYAWDTFFHSGRQNIFQSEDASKTMDLVKRAFLIYQHQPKFLKNVQKANFYAGGARSGILEVPNLHSEILGFPQGADQIRQYHPTGIFQDEAAYQSEAGAAFTAVKPAIEAGGRFTAVSSANPGWFQRACQDSLDM